MGKLQFADRLQMVSSSRTQQVTAAVDRLRREGADIIDLGAGEPDAPTPDHIKAAAVTALDQDFTRYTVGAGIVGLRDAIATHYETRYGVRYARDQIVVTSGGKQGLFNVSMALFGPGDEVVTHVPGWPSISEQVKLAGATPVFARTHAEEGFELRAEPLLDAVTPRTRGIIINSPGNPTGALISEDELRRLADGIRGRDIWLVVDLCYEQLIYDPNPHNLPGVLAECLAQQAVLIGSASKSYAMTGWRCGWLVAEPGVAAACNAVQSHSTSHAASITQRAAEAALRGPQDCLDTMRAEYRGRRDALAGWMADDGRFRVVRPAGAFYLFPDVTDVLDEEVLRTSSDLALALLTEAHVAVTPGEAFDAPGYLRLSYTVPMVQLEDAWRRILAYLG
jgi:aspartate aminotransferase